MKCFVCKKNSWESHYKDLFRCSNCGFIRAKEIYFKIKPEEVYGKDYFDKGQYANYKKERLALEQNFKNRLKDIIKHKREGKLLEIGCAYGYFLNLAKKNFIISGIDVNSQTTNIASKLTGIKTLTGDFLTQKFSFNQTPFTIRNSARIFIFRFTNSISRNRSLTSGGYRKEIL